MLPQELCVPSPDSRNQGKRRKSEHRYWFLHHTGESHLLGHTGKNWALTVILLHVFGQACPPGGQREVFKYFPFVFSRCLAHLSWTTSSTTIESCLQSTTFLILTWKCRCVSDLQMAVWNINNGAESRITFYMHCFPSVSSDCCLPVYSVPCSDSGTGLVHWLKHLQVTFVST